MTIERVREAIAFNAELADESTWLWLKSEQMGFPLRPKVGGDHEKRVEDLDSSQRVRDHLIAHHLAPAITDFIVDENQECCNNEYEQTLTREWSKKIKFSRQSSHIIHSLSATQLTRKSRSSCVEAYSGKHPQCQQLHMTLASFVSKKCH